VFVGVILCKAGGEKLFERPARGSRFFPCTSTTASIKMLQQARCVLHLALCGVPKRHRKNLSKTEDKRCSPPV
jgi:hypothetical protein